MRRPVNGGAERHDFTLTRCRLALLIAVCLCVSLSALYIALIVYLDNTNLGTTNGLWRSPWVHEWEAGAANHRIDTGELLYYPTFGFLCRLIPQSLVSYGVHGSMVIYRKIAFLNAFFSALASCAVFLLALRFTRSVVGALLVAIGHATTGFVVLHSINSEDVTPAYAFFVASAALFFQYVSTRKLHWLMLSALLLALTTVFHWTLMIPSLAALGAAQMALIIRREQRVWSLAAFLLVFLGALGAASLVLRALDPSLRFSLWQILYPSKAAPNGWLGFGWSKLIYAGVGIGNYFSGARNLGDYRLLSLPDVLRTSVVSWSYCALILGACVWALISRRTSGGLKLLAGFCGVLFAVGELEHLYSQPQDPQSQIQPMFVSIAGLIIIVSYAHRKLAKWAFRVAAVALLFAFMMNAQWTVRLMAAARGSDSRNVAAVQQLARIFPPDQVFVISQGFQEWTPWFYVEVHQGDMAVYLSKTLHLTAPFTNHLGISAGAAAEIIKQQIEEVFSSGRRVVASSLWVESKEEAFGWLSIIVGKSTADDYYDALRTAFRTGRSWDTPVGQFIELLPAKASSEDHRGVGR
jgi:hypothetical protein